MSNYVREKCDGCLQTFNLEVECRLCSEVYPEEEPIVEQCPGCGNPDRMMTIYLTHNSGECRNNRVRNSISERLLLRSHIDFDEWEYFTDEQSGIGIVVNHFRDNGEPSLNVFVVPANKVSDNDWHSDMYMVGYTGEQ